MEVKYGPYSSSRLDTAACPYRFKKQYIDRSVKDFGSPAARRGNVVHEVFERITAGWVTKKPLTWEDVSEILIQKLVKYSITDREDRLLCDGAVKDYMFNPPKMLDSIFGIEENLAAKWDEGKWVECEFDDPHAIYRGKIDILAIDGAKARIIDHKTQPHIEKAADTFQMGGYAWLVSINYPQVTEVESIIHYCRPGLNFYSQPFLWTREALKNIEAELRTAISVAENLEAFEPVSDFYCKYCPVQLDCPLLPQAKEHATKLGKVKKGPLMSAQEAKIAAEELNVLEEVVTILKKNIQNFVKVIGAVQISGKIYDYVPSESYDVKLGDDKKAIWDHLANFGLDPWVFFKVDVTALKKTWKVLEPEKLEKIKVHLTPTKKTAFRGKKA